MMMMMMVVEEERKEITKHLDWPYRRLLHHFPLALLFPFIYSKAACGRRLGTSQGRDQHRPGGGLYDGGAAVCRDDE